MMQAPRPLSHLLRMLAIAALVSTSYAQTDDYTDITKLLKVGKATEALTKVEQRLIATPRDPQLRFLRGVAQADSGKALDAIASFTRLTEDYPELPEPYNNLAVLYANQNQLDKARIALEMAIRTNPSYSTAHENMGDIYAKLASQAYNKALQLDETSAATIKPKLALIRELFAPTGNRKNNDNATTVAAAAPSTPAPAMSPSNSKPAAAPVKNDPPPAPAPTVVTTKPTAVAKNDPPATSPAAAPTKPAATVKNDPPVAAAAPAVDKATENAVESAVKGWADAWASKNMASYLGSYGPEFTPPGRKNRADWAKERESRIVGKNKISVDITNMSVSVDGNKATAKFHQSYKGDSLVSNSRKTLTLMKSNGRWVIVKEAVGG